MKTILKILFLSGIIGITAFSCGNEKQPPIILQQKKLFPIKLATGGPIQYSTVLPKQLKLLK